MTNGATNLNENHFTKSTYTQVTNVEYRNESFPLFYSFKKM